MCSSVFLDQMLDISTRWEPGRGQEVHWNSADVVARIYGDDARLRQCSQEVDLRTFARESHGTRHSEPSLPWEDSFCFLISAQYETGTEGPQWTRKQNAFCFETISMKCRQKVDVVLDSNLRLRSSATCQDPPRLRDDYSILVLARHPLRVSFLFNFRVCHDRGMGLGAQIPLFLFKVSQVPGENRLSRRRSPKFSTLLVPESRTSHWLSKDTTASTKIAMLAQLLRLGESS